MPAKSSPGSRSTATRRVLTWLGVLVGVLAATAAMVVVGLHTPAGRRFVLSRVTQLLASQQIALRADQLSFNLLDLSLNLQDVTVASPQASQDPPFAVISRLAADVSLLDLVGGRYVVESATMEGVTLHYVVHADGTDNVPRSPGDPDAPSEPLDYLIASLAVSNAHVRYENRAQQIDASVPVRSMSVKGNRLTDRHAVSLIAADGEVQASGRRARLDHLSADLDAGDDDLRVAHATVDAEGSHAELRGTLANFSKPQLDIRLRTTIDVPRAAAAAAIGEAPGGDVTVEASARGAADALEVDARIEGRDLTFRTLGGTSLDAHVNYDGSNRQVTTNDLQLRAPWGSITGRGVVSMADAQSSVSLSASAVDVETLMRALALPQAAASRADARVEARWPGLQYASATGQGQLFLTPTRARASRSTLPLGGRLAVRGDGDRIVAQLSAIRAAGTRLDGRVWLAGRERIGGALRAEVADLAPTISALEAWLGRRAGSLVPARVSGRATASATVNGTISRPAVKASIDAPALAVAEARGIALGGDIDYTPAALMVNSLDVTWGDAVAHAAGRFGLADRQRLSLAFSADRLPVASLLAAVGRQTPSAHGALSLSGTAEGTVGSPRVNASLRGSDLAVWQEPLGEMAADLTLAGRQVAVTQLALDKPQPDGPGHVSASGRYHLETGAYDFTLGSSNLQLVGLTLPDGRALRGGVSLKGKGEGSVRSPAGELTLAADRLRLAEHDLGLVSLDAAVANKRADVELSAARFGLTAHAVADLIDTYPARLDARIANLDLAALPLALETPLEGRVNATATASGNLTRPKRAHVNLAVESLEGTWNRQPFAIDGPAVLALADERLTIESLKLSAQDSTLSVTGTLPLDTRAGEGALLVDARANLATLSRYAPAESGLTADGALQLSGTIRGNVEAVDPDLQLHIDNARLATKALTPGITDLTARAAIADGVATLEQLTAHWSSARIEASGRVPLDLAPTLPVAIPRRGGPASFRASVVGLDPATVPSAPAGLGGRVSVALEGSAERPDLAALDGTLTFSELRLTFKELDLAQRQPSRIRAAAGVIGVEELDVSGSAGTLRARGDVGMMGARPVNLSVDGAFDTAVLATITDAVRTEGKASLHVSATGTLDAPNLDGALTLSDVMVAVDEPEIAAGGLSARLDLDGERITLSSLNAELNGGSLKGSGSLTIGRGGIADVDMRLETHDVAFDAPLDLRSLTDSTIRVTERDGDFLVNGKVTIREAGLTSDINFDTGLLATLNAPRSLDLTESRNPLLERVMLNVQVQTATPIVVDNNLARAEVRTNLRVLGTPYETGLSGNLNVLEGGEITLNERRYTVERGTVTFLEERRIVPSFDLRLSTTAGHYDVVVAVNGEPGNTESTLTSDPTLPEPDIMALLVTGRTLDQMRGEEGDIAKEQVLSYMAGRAGSHLGRGLERATGLSEVRLEPNLIANEADPSARLTIAQELTDDLTLVYSTDLSDSNDQIWVARYDVTRRFQTNAVRQSDNSYRLDFRHDVRKGGRPAPGRVPRTRRPTVASLDVQADNVLSEDEVRDRLGLEVGEPFDYLAARDGVNDLQQVLRERGRLQSRVRFDRRQDGDSVALVLRVQAGPVVDLGYEGVTPPAKTDAEVRRRWHRGVFDSQRAGDAVETLRAWLIADRYLAPDVKYTVVDTGPQARRVVFAIAPGRQSERIELEFQGASAIAPKILDDIIEEQHLERQLFTDPLVVTELLRRYYREEGYLVAEIDAPRYQFDGPVAKAVLQVREGPRFTVRAVTARGNRVIPTADVLSQLPVAVGDPFLPRAAERALDRIRQLYWSRAYNDVRGEYMLAFNRQAGTVDVAFSIREGIQAVVADVRIEGNDKTSERLVREQLELTPQQPLDLAALGRSRRNLYDTGAFSLVDITREAITPSGSPSQTDGARKPVQVNVTLREVQPFQLRYGASYDTERGVGGIVDVSNHNSLGKARVVGLSGRYDARLREGRLYMSQPSLRYWPVQTTAALYYRVERNTESALADPFNVDRYGVSIQQERELANAYLWSYGYRYEHARKFAPLPAGPGEWIAVAPLTSTFSRETRDEILDATTGSFTSHAFSYSPSWLGDDAAYLKYYGQYFHYIRLQPPGRKRFTNEVLRPRFVYAVGARVGLARGFGASVPETERFYAGGSTSLRGFEQNAVGPIGADRIPTGGQAMFVLNNEIRFPFIGFVDGVGFVDVGNVFDRLADFSFSDLRESAGFGVRLRTRWFLVRGDYGVVLDRRPGERSSRFYFSIGQAF